MFKKAILPLMVLAVLLFVEIQGNPVIESENVDELPASAIRGPRINPTEWINFNHSWSFPSFPSVTSLFYDDENNENGAILVRRRIDSLERTQKSIIEMLRKISHDITVLSAACNDKKPEILLPPKEHEEPILPGKPVIDKNEMATEILTAPSSAEVSEEQLPVTNVKPEVAQEPADIAVPVAPLIPQENTEPNLPSDDKNSNANDSSTQEIPEKIVIASTTLEENPGEKPFGSISLVGFAPPHDTRLNNRMPWKKDNNKSNDKASE